MRAVYNPRYMFPQRSASVKPERMHTKDGESVTSPEPEYDMLDLTSEEREAYDKVRKYYYLKIYNPLKPVLG